MFLLVSYGGPTSKTHRQAGQTVCYLALVDFDSNILRFAFIPGGWQGASGLVECGEVKVASVNDVWLSDILGLF